MEILLQKKNYLKYFCIQKQTQGKKIAFKNQKNFGNFLIWEFSFKTLHQKKRKKEKKHCYYSGAHRRRRRRRG